MFYRKDGMINTSILNGETLVFTNSLLKTQVQLFKLNLNTSARKPENATEDFFTFN